MADQAGIERITPIERSPSIASRSPHAQTSSESLAGRHELHPRRDDEPRCSGASTLDVRQRRVRLADRPFRLRQVDGAEHRRRAAARRHRRRHRRRPRSQLARPRPRAWCSRTTRCCPGSPSTRTSRSRSTRSSATPASRAERRDWILHNLEMVHMTHALQRLPSEISGGMKQRVGHRARAGDGAEGAAAGRAVRRARRADPRPPAGRGDAHPGRTGQHGDDDHARRRRSGAAVGPRS